MTDKQKIKIKMSVFKGVPKFQSLKKPWDVYTSKEDLQKLEYERVMRQYRNKERSEKLI